VKKKKGSSGSEKALIQVQAVDPALMPDGSFGAELRGKQPIALFAKYSSRLP